jgi:hypothetical protein
MDMTAAFGFDTVLTGFRQAKAIQGILGRANASVASGLRAANLNPDEDFKRLQFGLN